MLCLEKVWVMQEKRDVDETIPFNFSCSGFVLSS